MISNQAATYINIHEAKTHFSRIIDEIKENHHSVVIAKAGKPQVQIVPLSDATSRSQKFGFMRGEFEIPDNFDRMNEQDIAELFSGEK